MKLFTIFALVFPLACAAATNAEPFRYGGVEFTTNWFANNPKWRASRGVIYNVEVAKDWQWKTGSIVEVTNGIALVERRWIEDLYHTTPGYSYGRSTGNFLGGGYVPPKRTKIGETEKVERFLLTNAPAHFVEGWKVNTWLNWLGSDSLRGEYLPLFDYGTPPTQAEIDVLRAKFQAIAERGKAAKR